MIEVLRPIGLGPATSIYSETEPVAAWPPAELKATFIPAPYLGKTAVTDLVVLAERFRWTVVVTHSRGAWPSVGGRPGPQKSSLAVRMTRGTERAVAVYVEGSTWSWDSLWVWRFGEWTSAGKIGPFLDAVFGPLCKPAWPTDWALPCFGPLHGPPRPPRARKVRDNT